MEGFFVGKNRESTIFRVEYVYITSSIYIYIYLCFLYISLWVNKCVVEDLGYENVEDW